MHAEAKHQAVREAIVDMVTYYAVFNVMVTQEQLVEFLPVRANHLAVLAALRELINDQKIQRYGNEYGLYGYRYLRADSQHLMQENLLKKARSWARWLGLLPFVKSVVVINSAAYGNVTETSDIDLLVVTSPNRIFVAKAIIWQCLRMARQLERPGERAGRFSLEMFLTTRGVNFQRDIMRETRPHLVYWLLTAVPVYGKRAWLEVLQAAPVVRERTPNRIWPRGGKTIYRSGGRWLDPWDDRGYRVHLKHVSQQDYSSQEAAFIRLRPDIINLHPYDHSRDIRRRWEELRGIEKVAITKPIIRPRKPAAKKLVSGT